MPTKIFLIFRIMGITLLVGIDAYYDLADFSDDADDVAGENRFYC